ncbi:uncharacterized protein LOC117315835 [Pecten maximus]|uniref:uncharacterized protein LOC117315835 n=1 Tax=Pecten maximus TaxID=6579 RepID=UPI00145862F4|nr:uncharacterized protein LOC117315835 [Pecten maximus]
MDVSSTQESLLEDHLLLTNKINIHRCSDYCLRNPKRKNISEKECRMEFGSSSNPGKELRTTPAIVNDKNGSPRLEMARDHPMLVQHSQYHTQAWRANGDISIILSKSDPENPSVNDIIATEKYVTGYACKGGESTGAVVDFFNDMINSSSDDSTTKSLCTKLLMQTTKRDVSAVEASFELSNLPLYRCSHTFQNVSLSGSRVLERTGKTLTKKTSLDKYISRPDNATESWYGYICKSGYVPVISGKNIYCTWPLTEEYCRTMILLHWPNWRKISDIKKDNISWSEKMSEFLQMSARPNFVKADVERARLTSKKGSRNDDDGGSDDDSDGNEDVLQPEWIDLVQPNVEYKEVTEEFNYNDGGIEHDWSTKSAKYPPDLGIQFLEQIISDMNSDQEMLNLPDVDISSLNTEQEFAFNLVIKAILDSIHSPNVHPLRLIVAGTAGSGKSYLNKCLVKTIRLLFQSNKCVQVLCPTGSAANLISGVTIHSFLKIPIVSKSKEMTLPTGHTAESLQENCDGLKVLLVDERSLIGCSTLGWMEFNCRFGMKSDSNWGGLPVVVLLGDDVQLSPVLDSPLYKPNANCPAAMHGSLVWQDFNTAVTLKTIIRQNESQQQLKSVLTSLRQYKLTPDQATWLQNYQWDDLRKNFNHDLSHRISQNGLYVFPTHNEEWKHNKNKILEINKVYPIAKTVALKEDIQANTCTSDKAGGLLSIVYLCKDAKVMLTSNLCVKYGLFNGSVGTVIDIIYPENETPKTSLPLVVMVQFDKYTGPPFIHDIPKCVPITSIKRGLECPCHNCKITQIPLRLGWGTTIHRCQGMTIGENESSRYIVISPGTKSFESRNPGALFVALSRAKTAGSVNEDPDFAWHPSVLVNQDRFCHVVNTPTTQARDKEIKRIETLSLKTKENYANIKYDEIFQGFISNIKNSSPSIEE